MEVERIYDFRVFGVTWHGGGGTGNEVSVAEGERERSSAARVWVQERGEVCGSWLSGKEGVGFQTYARSYRPFTLSRTT